MQKKLTRQQRRASLRRQRKEQLKKLKQLARLGKLGHAKKSFLQKIKDFFFNFGVIH